MKIQTIIRFTSLALICSAFSVPAAAENFTDAIGAFLQHRREFEKSEGAIVVGLVDEHGSSVISHGTLGSGAGREVNGDTVFNLYSQTCVYTALLLHDMIERGEMKLDDPVAKYLPKSVKIPIRNGKQITLRHLVTESAGLPDFADKLDPKRADDPYADYTVERMYAFLSSYHLTRDPGEKFVHGGVDMGLLGHAMALKAGTNYESLVVERICRPLQMDNTRLTLTPEQKSRLAFRYNPAGYPMPDLDWGVLSPLAGLHSTAHDLMKFVAANLGLRPSSLTPLMERHLAHFVWGASPERKMGIIDFGGGGMFGGSAYSGFDKTRRRGVVVLYASGNGQYNARTLGKFLLECEWQSDRPSKETKISSEVYDSYAGQYQRSPDLALGRFAMRQFLLNAPKATACVAAGFGLAALSVLLWRAGGWRKRWIIVGCVILVGALSAPILALMTSRVFCARFQPRIAIRSQGDRLFAQATGLRLWPVKDWNYAQATGLGSQPIDVLWPLIPGELCPESETRLFERLSRVPLTFSPDNRGKVTGLTLYYQGKAYAFEKISDQPPPVSEPPNPRVAIKLDRKFLGAIVGHYEFAPNSMSPTGIKMAIWREEDQLISQVWGENVLKGAFQINPESETNFFLEINGAQLTFIKNEQGEATVVIHRLKGYPDIQGKKVRDSTH